MNPILSNCVSATLTDNDFFHDLASSVSNDGSSDTAALWLWSMLRGDYYTFIRAIEGLVKVWPVVRIACEMFDTNPAPVSRFVAERIPAAMDETVSVAWAAPVTAAIVISERAHDLAGFFSVGLKPNGSKDPYALRRSAKHLIIASTMI